MAGRWVVEICQEERTDRRQERITHKQKSRKGMKGEIIFDKMQ